MSFDSIHDSAGFAGRNGGVQMRTESFDTPGQAVVWVKIAAGNVSIENGPEGQTSVELEALRGRDAERDVEEARVGTRTRSDGVVEVYVELQQQRFGWIGRSSAIAVRVTCPPGTHIECSTASADVVARGAYGDVAVKSASGNLVVDDVSGSLSMHTASGYAHAREVGRDATLHAVSGNLQVEHVGGALNAKTVSGDLTAGAIGGRVSANSVSGAVGLAEIAASTEVRSISGDGARVYVDAHSVSGALRSDLDLGDAPPPGEGQLVKIRARTVSGSVTLTRATEAA
jgi:hypothetical protein